VLVLGAGSGVSTFAVQLAAQEGARVLVTSSSEEKIERAKELGAAGGVLYTEEGWPEAAGPVDVVLDSVGSTWRDSLRALRPGGRLVVFGGTGGAEVALDVRATYLNWKSILGTTMGSARDFFSLMRMVTDGDWQPVIDSVRPLDEAGVAHDRMTAGEHFGKLVLATA
jgi:zinc-binding alcohol dehydrogenase/oxidoreductase